MPPIIFPDKLERLLNGSDFNGAIRTYSAAVGTILANNKLTFFPDYTDHGLDHINRVLSKTTELITSEVWGCGMLTDADAVLMIGSTLLHDIAMHLQPVGFLELISGGRFKPLPWFESIHEGFPGDRPWDVLWNDYMREARRFSDQKLQQIVGERAVAQGWRFSALPANVGSWEHNHLLIIGEFIRRHHARLAHEIAMYGFPGAGDGTGLGAFPAIGKGTCALFELADLIGLVARSHGMSLRICADYLHSHHIYGRALRPHRTVPVFAMALLRVSDYFQIDTKRAPHVLLQLHDPQSPVSIQEWKNNQSVVELTESREDPQGVEVTLSPNISATTYTQLKRLIEGMQSEIDHSTVVLDELYGRWCKSQEHPILGLAVRRVHSNLATPEFLERLDFVPPVAEFSSDPSLIKLLVEPLYGKHPEVGVRELVQNSVDAVRELAAWRSIRSIQTKSVLDSNHDGDVLIEFRKQSSGAWILKICDQGIGMDDETIRSYFLRAGASLRRSDDWAHEFTDDKGGSRVMKSGRFGIGACAIFLLGNRFKVWTRRVDGELGFVLQVSEASEQVEIRKISGLEVGTTIEVEINASVAESLSLDAAAESGMLDDIGDKTDWYCWAWPRVLRRIVSVDRQLELPQRCAVELRESFAGPEWFRFEPPGFNQVYWTFDFTPNLVCNGFSICRPGAIEDTDFEWPADLQIKKPALAIMDGDANLPITIDRYALSDKKLPFQTLLLDEMKLNIVAHSIICAPSSPIWKDPLILRGDRGFCHPSIATIGRKWWYPWCSTGSECVPCEPSLFALLGKTRLIVCGCIESGRIAPSVGFESKSLMNTPVIVLNKLTRDFEEAWDFMGGLCQHGIFNDGPLPKSVQIALSMDPSKYSFASPKFYPLRDVKQRGTGKRKSGRIGYELSTSKQGHDEQTAKVLDSLEESFAAEGSVPAIIYVAAMDWDPSFLKQPRSDIAKQWVACLGEAPVPLSGAKRASFISLAKEHASLNPHINAWEFLIRDGSPLVKKFRYSEYFHRKQA